MITVETWRKQGGHICRFRISGHADAEDSQLGYDIVCASVSAISLTCAFGLQDVLHVKGRYDSRSGYLLVDIGDNADRYTEAVIQTMLAGLSKVQQQFPERIKIKNLRR